MKASYTQVLSTKNGALGFRDIGGSQFRVRVEPTNSKVILPSGWKTPDSYDKRFSIVVNGTAQLAAAVATGASALTAVSSVSSTVLENAKYYLSQAQSVLLSA